MFCVALPRVIAWHWADNLYGDAVVRMQLAEAWRHAPHLIRSFSDGALQFGPLHIMSLGTWMSCFSETHAAVAGKLLSLTVGALSAIPLWCLTRTLFDRRAAWIACAGLSLWGLHIQASTTAASEALGLFFLLAGLSSVVHERGSLGRAALSGGCFTLACAVRYDAWMMGALMCLVRLGPLGLRTNLRNTGVFAAALASFPLLWMVGNAVDMGDPLYPLHFVEQYHRTWMTRELGWYGQTFGDQGPLVFRTANALFWPGAALMSLSPAVAVFAGVGMFSPQARSARWLAALVVFPSLYFSVRAAVWMNFVPLARFAMPQLVLLLPFVDVGIRWTAERWKVSEKILATATLGCAGAWSLALALGTVQAEESSWAKTLRPLSPITPQPSLIQKLYTAVRALPQSPVLLDAAAEYQDIQLSAQPLPAPRQWRLLRQQKVGALSLDSDVPGAIIVFAGGVLGAHPALAWRPGGLSFKTISFQEVSGLPTGARLFVRSPSPLCSNVHPCSDSSVSF